MFVKSAAGKRAFVFFACLLLCASVAFSAVSCVEDDGTSQGESQQPEISQQEESEEKVYAEFEAPAPSLPVILQRPETETAKSRTVDVGLSYGNNALKKLELSATDGDMLVFGGNVYKNLSVIWENGVMYIDGRACNKACVRSAAPIALSSTGWSYEGEILLTCGKKGITVVNRVDIEAYVKGVMSAEIGADGSYESRKAFSVICRTLVYVAKDHGEDFDLCNRNCCQSYRGTYHRDATNDKAVDETKGMVLTYNGAPCLVAYSSSHGYNSCSSFAAWVGADIPYLRVVRYENEPLDYGGRWEVTYTYEQLSKRLKNYTVTGQVKSVSVAETDPYGSSYVYRLNITDTAGNVREIKFGGNIMNVLGVRCANFIIEKIAGGITIHGIGNGHGVGYSQRGGHQMGAEGYSFEDILYFYFPGTAISPCGGF